MVTLRAVLVHARTLGLIQAAPYGKEQASLEGQILRRCSLGQTHVSAVRRVGWVRRFAQLEAT